MLRTELVDNLKALAPLRAEWDALAAELGRPFCAPAWTLRWWAHAAPEAAVLRVIVVRDGEDLVAVAPFFAETRRGVARYRLLAAAVSARVEPLARLDSRTEVADAVVGALRSAHPAPDVLHFEGVPIGSLWAPLLAFHWQGARLQRDMTMPAPVIAFGDRGYEEWLASRSGRWRREVRRRRRRLQEMGGEFKVALSADDVIAGLPAFARLHYGRWGWRGGSQALSGGVERMLSAVASDLGGTGRIRLWTIDVGGQTVSSQLFVGAGPELAYWLGGFDERWATYGPSTQAVVAALEHASSAGDRRVDLGAGGQAYKLDLATSYDVLEWSTVIPPGPRAALARAALVPDRVRRGLTMGLAQRMSPELKNRLKRTLRSRTR